MKTLKVLVIYLTFLAANCIVPASTTVITDKHTIDYTIEGHVRVGGGDVILTTGGIVGSLQLDHGSLTIDDGEVLGHVGSDHPTLFITGGIIRGDISSCDWGNNVTISGGMIYGDLHAMDGASIVVHGTKFNYDYGIIPDNTGHLTGILSDGTPIDVGFSCSPNLNCDIILAPIPEPATMAMLGLGSVMLRKRK